MDILKLPRVEFSQKRMLPRISGVYFVLAGDSVLYIGATKNLHQRWNIGGHHQRKALIENGCTALAWVVTDPRGLKRREAALISEVRPPLNVRLFGGKMVNVHIYFPVKVLNDIRKLAAVNRRTVSAEIVIAAERHVEASKPTTNGTQGKGGR
jgi:excinuclease UvrABC nuclease subunit